jgi:hypothetical protein
MRVVMLEAPPEVEAMLAERRRSGLDVRDEMVPVQPGPDGEHTSEVLGTTLRTVDGKLEITWDGGSASV